MSLSSFSIALFIFFSSSSLNFKVILDIFNFFPLKSRAFLISLLAFVLLSSSLSSFLHSFLNSFLVLLAGQRFFRFIFCYATTKQPEQELLSIFNMIYIKNIFIFNRLQLFLHSHIIYRRGPYMLLVRCCKVNVYKLKHCEGSVLLYICIYVVRALVL
jgi:hypothetical protein